MLSGKLYIITSTSREKTHVRQNFSWVEMFLVYYTKLYNIIAYNTMLYLPVYTSIILFNDRAILNHVIFYFIFSFWQKPRCGSINYNQVNLHCKCWLSLKLQIQTSKDFPFIHTLIHVFSLWTTWLLALSLQGVVSSRIKTVFVAFMAPPETSR